ncbi:hypothetical protein ELI02_33645 [Rhizobium leguminosarum]|uniref:hypothetical protein n=1 Tax=Rhizobium leguminosarum TaxID=384 RepID=UPI00102F53D3|nr:hypothetical protein [Rhizobium leguminosarum]TAX43494.1 hypothetical protein ELI02_33645 [Rhizobium leguminosarum]TAX47697.1 hypothetical protein ELI01_26045 [Rhizobium leguminosarum]TAY61620.1 hypothetical protein ELH82_28720 [Rhizobium leguminosarum]
MPDRAKSDRLRLIHRFDDSVITSGVLLLIPYFVFVLLPARASPQARTDKAVDTKLVVQLCNRMDTAAAEYAGQHRLPQ